ncbi:MAG: glycine--tRNA ligase subunit beta, partial [Pelagibacteraceae bacterium]
MSDFFLELYSEEIPHGLQISARNQLTDFLKKELDENNISFKEFNTFSTPKRLVIYIDQINLSQNVKAQEV